MTTSSRAFAAAITILAASGAWAAPAPCKPGDEKCANAAITKLPVHNLAFWSEQRFRSLRERIGIANPVLVDFLALENLKYAYPNQPRAPNLSPDFVTQVRNAIDELPPVVKQLAERKLVGLALVEDLGGTGFSDVVQDENGRMVAGFIVLDSQVLASRRANAWATWKDNTPFQPMAGRSLSVRIENDADDTTQNAIQYIFLHELGHVLSIGADLHPSWIVAPRDVASTTPFVFFNLSWLVDRKADRYRSRFDADFPERTKVAFYFGAKLTLADAAPVYEKLRNTNFATLYSVNAPGDDFAEAFANYVHTVLMHKPFEVRITGPDRTLTYTACWAEQRCAAKRRIIESLLGGAKI